MRSILSNAIQSNHLQLVTNWLITVTIYLYLASHFHSPSSVIFSVAGLNVGKIENFYKVQIPNGKSYKPCYSIDIGKFNEKNKIS